MASVRLFFRELADTSTPLRSEPGERRPWWHALLAIGLGLGAPSIALCLWLQHASSAITLQFGGRGGIPAVLTCDDPARVVGAQVFTRDATVAGISLLCGRPQDGPSAAASVRGRVGSATPTVSSLRCPLGSAAVGIWGASGALLDRFSLTCARQPMGPVVHLDGVGGTGGSGFHQSCRKTWLRGVTVHAGELLDSVGMICGDDER